MTGNQHHSRKATLMFYLRRARSILSDGMLDVAREYLATWRKEYAEAPAGTRRRWKCGK